MPKFEWKNRHIYSLIIGLNKHILKNKLSDISIDLKQTYLKPYRYGFNAYNAEYFVFKPWRLKGFYNHKCLS